MDWTKGRQIGMMAHSKSERLYIQASRTKSGWMIGRVFTDTLAPEDEDCAMTSDRTQATQLALQR